MKAIYYNDCQYNFEVFDNFQHPIICEFKSDRPITFLDLRKIEISSIIKGEVVCNHKQIEEQLEKLHLLTVSKVGTLVNTFSLFSNSLESYVEHLDSTCLRYLTEISKIPIFYSIETFLITKLEKNEFLSNELKGLYPHWKSLYMQKIYTIRDLVNLTKTELLRVHNIGINRANELEELLKKHDLHLKEE